MKKSIKILLLVTTCIVFLMALTACSLFGAGGDDNNNGDTPAAKTTLSESMVTVGGQYSYTGKPIEVAPKSIIVTVNGSRVSYDQFTYTYANNTEIGQGLITITAKDTNTVCTGSVTVSFTIVGADFTATTQEAFLGAVGNENYNNIFITREIEIEEGTMITVPETQTVFVTTVATFKNNGTIINKGKIMIGGTANAIFTNNGTITNSGTISVADKGTIYNLDTITNTGKIENAGIIRSNEQDIASVTKKDNGEYTVRHQITAEDVELEYESITFDAGLGQIKPSYVVEADIVSEVSENDTKAGQASLTLTVRDSDDAFYGSVTLYYEILKGEYFINASDVNALYTAQASGNYDKYTLASGTLTIPNGDTFTLKEGETLTVKGLQVNGTMENQGKIVFGASYCIISGKLTNKGSISDNAMQVNGIFNNEANGTVNVSALYYDNGTILNKGKIHAVDVIVYAGEDFSNDGGDLWTTTSTLTIPSSGVHIQTSLSNATAALEYTSIPFDGTEHKPTFTVNGNSLGQNDYTIKYAYTINADETDFSKAGEINVTITITNSFCDYYGTTTLSYSIVAE